MFDEVDPGVIIIVEDPFIRKFLRCALARAGYRTLEMEADAARQLMRSGEVPVRALVTNEPPEFREFAKEIHLVYTTSCPEPDAIRGFEHSRIVRKPFHAGQLVDALKELAAPVIP